MYSSFCKFLLNKNLNFNNIFSLIFEKVFHSNCSSISDFMVFGNIISYFNLKLTSCFIWNYHNSISEFFNVKEVWQISNHCQNQTLKKVFNWCKNQSCYTYTINILFVPLEILWIINYLQKCIWEMIFHSACKDKLDICPTHVIDWSNLQYFFLYFIFHK